MMVIFSCRAYFALALTCLTNSASAAPVAGCHGNMTLAASNTSSGLPSYTTAYSYTSYVPTQESLPPTQPAYTFGYGSNNASQYSSSPSYHTATPTQHATNVPGYETTSSDPQSSSTSRYGTISTRSNMIDPFAAIETGAPPQQIPQTGGHPQPTNNIIHRNEPLHTNKFYANMFLGSGMNGIFTTPYVLSWSNGSGQSSSYGMAISHTEAYQRAMGDPNPNIPGSPASFFINPLGIQSIVLSANELTNGTRLSAENLDTFSAQAVLHPPGSSASKIRFPLVEGMGLVTGVYANLQPQVQSGVFFSSVNSAGPVASGIYKWQIALEDGRSWLMYVVPDHDNGTIPGFSLSSNSLIQGPANFSGFIQIAKNPASSAGEAIYDRSAGIFATDATISGSVHGNLGSYTLKWAVHGKNVGQPLLHYALPHQVESFDNATRAKVIHGMQLQTTTKGNATAVAASHWTMVEKDLPTSMGFAPWSPSNGSVSNLSQGAVNAIYAAAQTELQQDMIAQSNLNSMYYSGKALSKFASIIYAVNDLCRQPALAQQGLNSLKAAFSIFSNNTQDFPLYYDTVWKGVVSSASYGGDPGADFGNTFYNDHHFHYGYFLHAAAVIGYLDPTWLAANKDWVNALARDVSNPSPADPWFPVFRSFDWFHGHSFAKGLFESGDGKDEESSSEDVMFSYGLKMWGQVVGDSSMEARGNLMLSVQRRSLQQYFLMESDNTNQPRDFIGNKVTGIMFENKIDHTTYFGGNFEYVQGIHMIPLMPASALTRNAKFVSEEWQTYFAPGAVTAATNVTGGWKGILYANLALIDPVSSFNFFASNDFDNSWLDGGASRTWYLAFAAGLGGA